MKEPTIICKEDLRRKSVREKQLNGLDHLDEGQSQKKLYVYFLGKLPAGLTEQNAMDHVQIEGGQRIRDIRIVDVDLVHRDEPELDDYMVVHLDKRGDFSTYTLRLVNLDCIDSRYDHLKFNFLAGCPSDLDCKEKTLCPPPKRSEPDISYLAKDYSSFRKLILDRLSLIMPQWQDRHVPDIGIALVELLAYAGDHLSYYQDAVATEAYLDTARQRISVRRHVRLVDYLMHEGCNSRAWVSVETEDYTRLEPEDYFLAATGTAPLISGKSLTEEELGRIPPDRYLVFEPLIKESQEFFRAHNSIEFYTWCGQECCLLTGATSATLKDEWVQAEEAEVMPFQEEQSAQHYRPAPPPSCEQQRSLRLSAGDVLIFEEVLGPKTGNEADADPDHRHAVRLTKVTPGIDDLNCQPIVDIEWDPEDALPFMLCISSLSQPPECELLENVSVARGNVVLVDHGRTLDPESLIVPEGEEEPGGCKGVGEPNETIPESKPLRPRLGFFPVTHAVPFPESSAACQVQARILTGLLDRVLYRVEELWKKSRSGVCLSKQEIAEVGRIFGAKALDDADLVYSKPVKGRDSPCKKQARALSRLLDLEKVYLARKRRRLEILAKRARSGYLMGANEAKEIESIFGEIYALELEDSSNHISASSSIRQDPRLANPWICLTEKGSGAAWTPKSDLLGSGPLDRHFVAEIENDGHVRLRFGDGNLGEMPESGVEMEAVYRVGNGLAGNVGREAISYLVFHIPGKNGILRVRNPLPAEGGTDPEPLADAKLFAPGSFRKDLKRAITTEDYAMLVERDFEERVQRAAAQLRWNGSWYEVQVAVDPRQTTEVREVLLDEVAVSLQRYRRIGHNLSVRPAAYVPLDIEMIVCVLPNHHPGQVKADLLDVLSSGVLPDGKLGLFHPDNLTFGIGIRLSNLVAAAQAVPGVENIVVTKLERLFEGPEHEIENGILPIGPMEVARLDNDPSFPENGRLTLLMRGGI
jgi:hypothetical protein